MSQSSSIAFNICQNQETFTLEPIEDQTPLFRFKYLEKTLNPIKNNPEDINNYQTVTVKCLVKGCK